MLRLGPRRQRSSIRDLDAAQRSRVEMAHRIDRIGEVLRADAREAERRLAGWQ